MSLCDVYLMRMSLTFLKLIYLVLEHIWCMLQDNSRNSVKCTQFPQSQYSTDKGVQDADAR